MPKKKHHKKKVSKSLRPSNLYISMLLVALVVGWASVNGIVSLSAKNSSGIVLSENSGSGGGGDDNGGDDDSEDEEDESDDDNEDSNDDENEDEVEDENEAEDDSDDDGIDGDVDDDDDNDGILDLDEDNSGSSNERKTRQTITNPDGTTSQIRTEVKSDGEIKTEVRTFSSEGNKISVEKFESQDGKEKTRIRTFDETGTKLTDFEFETEDGKKLELRLKEGDVELSRVVINQDKHELIVRAEDESRIRIRTLRDNFVISREGINALSKFPISIDDATGQIYVKTPAGDVQLNAMPDTIVAKARASDDLDVVNGVSLDTQQDETTNVEYVVTGTKSEKLLGLFSLKIPSRLSFDAKTGGFLNNDQGFVTRILDLFSL